MAIRVNYTPYGAVGGLATLAGQQQQAVREQQMAHQAAMQQASIEANERQLRQQLTAQQQQAAMQQAGQAQQNMVQQILGGVQQGLGYIQKQQALDLEKEYKERAFALQEAAAERASRSLTMQEEQQKLTGMKLSQGLKEAQTERAAQEQRLRDWQALKNQVDPVTYSRGLTAISQGKVPPAPPKPTTTSTKPMSRLDIENFQERVDDIIKSSPGWWAKKFGVKQTAGELSEPIRGLLQMYGFSGLNQTGRQQMLSTIRSEAKAEGWKETDIEAAINRALIGMEVDPTKIVNPALQPDVTGVRIPPATTTTPPLTTPVISTPSPQEEAYTMEDINWNAIMTGK